MVFGSDVGSLLTLLGVVLLAFLLLDLFGAGGCATSGVMGGIGGMMGGIGGMMGGVANAMGTPWGWGLLLLVAAIVAVLARGGDLLPGL
jgi:hypothetical protein